MSQRGGDNRRGGVGLMTAQCPGLQLLLFCFSCWLENSNYGIVIKKLLNIRKFGFFFCNEMHCTQTRRVLGLRPFICLSVSLSVCRSLVVCAKAAESITELVAIFELRLPTF